MRQCATLVTLAAVLVSGAYGLIDPERPLSWLVGECRTIAVLKTTAVEKGLATFDVVRVLKGELKDKQVTVRWTAAQQPPIEKDAVGAAAVLLIPKDDEDPALLHVSAEFLSLAPDKKQAGQYEFLRPNGFVKGSFNGEADDFIAVIEDTLAGRAYFPIWADTSFAPAVKIGDLPAAASALAVGDLDGDGRLDLVAATAKGLAVYQVSSGDGNSAATAPRQTTLGGGALLKQIGPARMVQLVDADGDGRLDVLTDAGLFLARGGEYVAATGASGKRWSSAALGLLPGRAGPAILAVEDGRLRVLARAQDGAWADRSAELGADKLPAGLLAVSVGYLAEDRVSVVVATSDALVCLEATANQPLRQIQSLPLAQADQPAPRNVHLIQRDLDGDGLGDVFLAGDGAGRFFRRQADGRLTEVPDHLGDVRKMFQPVELCAGIIGEDFNNDGLIDLVAWSKQQKLLLVMNRGYHNLREGTELFNLPAAQEKLPAVDAAAAADFDADGDLDLVVACGQGLYLLANTFERKPEEEANDRPRHPLLTVRAPGRFGALVAIEDKDGKPLAARRMGDSAVADTLYFGYRSPVPATVVLRGPDGRTVRQQVSASSARQALVFPRKALDEK